jgi:hypothetical protein
VYRIIASEEKMEHPNKIKDKVRNDSILKLALRFITGFGVFLLVIALVTLFSGEFGAFFAVLVMGSAFIGLGWAGRRILLPDQKNTPPNVGLVSGIIFGGAGVVMIIGSLFLYWDGEFGGAVGLFIFGIVFCGAGYIGYRVFRVPAGKKAVLVNERQQSVRGVFVSRGLRTSRRYMYVDENMSESAIARMQQGWSEKPWLQRDDWAQGKVVQSGAGSNKLMVGFTIIWNIISYALAVFAMISTWGSGDEPWFILIFPLVGLALIIVTVRTMIRERKYGISILNLATVPVYLGEVFMGTVETSVSARLLPTDGFCVRLVCSQRSSFLDREGDKRVTEEKLWSEEQQVEAFVTGTGDTLSFTISFTIPADLPATQLIPEDNRTYWRLDTSAAMPGVDYAAQFEIPVFSKE